MSVTWRSPDPPPETRRAPGHWVLVVWRGARIALVLLLGVMATLLVRGLERLMRGGARPWSPAIAVWVYRRIFVILGIAHVVEGTPMRGPGALVANHISWLDIFAIGASAPVTFVSKAEVAGWPGIGALARLVGTVFITRDPRAAKAHTALLCVRLAAGQPLVFFPEGTSTDGMRLRPFKSTLFEAICAVDAESMLHVQPVTLVYEAPEGADPRIYGWWGDMAFAAHLLAVLGARRQGRVRVVFHMPLDAGMAGGRKALAATAEAAVRAGLPEDRRGL